VRRSLAALIASGLLLASAAGAELRRLEVVGVVPAGADAQRGVPIRRAAVQAALEEAVARVVRDVLSARGGAQLLAEAPDTPVLGEDPSVYAIRYRVIEDRGERRALLVTDPEVSTEYVLLVAVTVDAGRVEARLGELGLLAGAAPSGQAGGFRLVVEDPPSYAAYQQLREHLLAGPARTALPESFEAGRVVLRVEAPGGSSRLLDRLLTAPPRGLEVVPLSASEETLVVRLRLQPVGPEPD